MNVLFDVNHPAHVHFFKHTINNLKEQGHAVTVTARDKDVTIQLLKAYGLEYQVLSEVRHGALGLLQELIIRQSRLSKIIQNNKIQICVAIAGTFCVHISRLLGIPCLVFYDTEDATFQNAITFPFASAIFTPDCYEDDIGKKQVRYSGVHELAYLHPNYFQIDDSAFALLDLDPNEKYVILRFVSWGASHDAGQKGMSQEMKHNIVKQLADHARVFIVSEGELDDDLKPFQLSVSPERLHAVLSGAALCIGESPTVVSECACLGVPSIYVSTRKLGYVNEAARYGLVFDLSHESEILNRAVSILQNEHKDEWQRRRQNFLQEKIDVTEFVTHTITDYAKTLN